MAATPRTEALERRIEQGIVPEQTAAISTMVAPETVATEDGVEARHEAIATAAYLLAEARGFEPGHEVDDWLAAEQQLGFRL